MFSIIFLVGEIISDSTVQYSTVNILFRSCVVGTSACTRASGLGSCESIRSLTKKYVDENVFVDASPRRNNVPKQLFYGALAPLTKNWLKKLYEAA